MNNFVFGSTDPLLYSPIVSNRNQPNEQDLKRQLDNMMVQYQNMQNQYQEPPQPKDHLGELDEVMKKLDESVMANLSSNEEFVQLNNYIQQTIQAEIIKSVKWKINSNQDVVQKIEKLKGIINNAHKEQENEDKKNLSELNDYIKNYSDLTFNEYKQLKQSKL